MTKRAFDKIAAGLNDAIAYANGDAGRARAARPVLASVHEAASALHGIGLVDDMAMCEFDALCLAPTGRPRARRGRGGHA